MLHRPWSSHSMADSCASGAAKRAKCSSDMPDLPEGVTLPDNYKMRKCRYCKTTSCSVNPWPLTGTVLHAWAPLTPWNRGTRDKPIGELCRCCQIAPCHDPNIVFLFLTQGSITTRPHRQLVYCAEYRVSLSLSFNCLDSAMCPPEVWTQGGFEADWQTEDRFQKALTTNPTLLHGFLGSRPLQVCHK